VDIVDQNPAHQRKSALPIASAGSKIYQPGMGEIEPTVSASGLAVPMSIPLVDQRRIDTGIS